jgi:hypothetical protein
MGSRELFVQTRLKLWSFEEARITGLSHWHLALIFLKGLGAHLLLSIVGTTNESITLPGHGCSCSHPMGEKQIFWRVRSFLRYAAYK